MVMVSVGTMDWHSIRPSTLRRMPRSETVVMVVTVAVVVATHNLATGVVVGVLVAMALFVRRVAHLVRVVDVEPVEAGTRVYAVEGELFFASSNDLVGQFDYAGDPDQVVVDLSRAHVWDASTVATLDAVQTRYAVRGKSVTFRGLDAVKAARHERLSGKLTAGH